MKVEGSFQKYTMGCGRVILKYDTRGGVVLQNDYVLDCTIVPDRYERTMSDTLKPYPYKSISKGAQK
jgi:hypothetical protein